jgi:hypothetical protein
LSRDPAPAAVEVITLLSLPLAFDFATRVFILTILFKDITFSLKMTPSHIALL